VAHEVVFRPAADADLAELYAYIRDRNQDPTLAIGYVRRIRDHCERLASFPERGARRNDLGPGLRTIGFERRATIVYRIEQGRVEIVRILYGGRDIEAALREN
jgi:toxin ParE1/3/4